MNRRKLREVKRWRELLRAGGAPDFDDFYKEWKARELPPLTSRAMHDERAKTRAMIDDLEWKNDVWPPILTSVAAILTILSLVLAYLFIR